MDLDDDDDDDEDPPMRLPNILEVELLEAPVLKLGVTGTGLVAYDC